MNEREYIAMHNLLHDNLQPGDMEIVAQVRRRGGEITQRVVGQAMAEVSYIPDEEDVVLGLAQYLSHLDPSTEGYWSDLYESQQNHFLEQAKGILGQIRRLRGEN